MPGITLGITFAAFRPKPSGERRRDLRVCASVLSNLEVSPARRGPLGSNQPRSGFVTSASSSSDVGSFHPGPYAARAGTNVARRSGRHSVPSDLLMGSQPALASLRAADAGATGVLLAVLGSPRHRTVVAASQGGWLQVRASREPVAAPRDSIAAGCDLARSAARTPVPTTDKPFITRRPRCLRLARRHTDRAVSVADKPFITPRPRCLHLARRHTDRAVSVTDKPFITPRRAGLGWYGKSPPLSHPPARWRESRWGSPLQQSGRNRQVNGGGTCGFARAFCPTSRSARRAGARLGRISRDRDSSPAPAVPLTLAPSTQGRRAHRRTTL